MQLIRVSVNEMTGSIFVEQLIKRLHIARTDMHYEC